MQANPVSDHQLVAICMTAVCRKAGFPDPTRLVQRDLQFLSEAVESGTGVLISVSTMKRLLNGQFSRLPQIATLDALARFLDYPNWQQFTIDRRPVEAKTDTVPERPGALITPTRMGLAIGLLLLATLALIAVITVRKPGPSNLRSVQFSAVKATSNELPNTVVFHYNVDSIAADSFFIQQSWDSSRRVRIYPKSYTLTDIYYEPGYHNAKLIANDRILKVVPVSIPTDRWFFYAKERFSGSLPRYIHPADPVKDGALQLTPDDLTASGIDTQKQNIYFEVYFPSRIDAATSDFTLQFRVRMKEVGNVSCPFIMSEVFCQRYFMFFKTSRRGCTSELNAQFGETHLSGKTRDLTPLGTDITQWQRVALTVRNGAVRIRINDVEALATPYQGACGSITGLGFISSGLCAIDSVDLRTGDGKIVYTNDFQ
jgi:hypothetical protein